MNSKNSKASDPERLIFNLSDKTNLKSSNKYIALSNISMCYTEKNIKKSYKNDKFKISSPTWNDKFELPDGSCPVSDIQNYFDYIIEKDESATDNPQIKIYVTKIENTITFEVKTGYYLELLIPKTMKLFRSTKNKIMKDKNGENVPYLEINEVILSTMLINEIQESCIHLFQMNHLVKDSIFHQKRFIFLKSFNYL